MGLTPKSSRQNGTRSSSRLAVASRSRSPTPPPPLPQLLPRPSIEVSPSVRPSAMSPSNDLVPPFGYNRKEEMKIWLNTKAEEDRLKQEEERSYQANVVLEQRRIEQEVINDCLRAGVPPNLVPLVFQGIYTTGANLRLAAELQRHWSSPANARPVPAMPKQPSYPVPAHSESPLPPQQFQQAPQLVPQILYQLPPSESRATAYLPGMSQHPPSEARLRLHRSRSRSDRKKLERELNPPKEELADQNSPDSDPKHDVPATVPMNRILPPLGGFDRIDSWAQGLPPPPPPLEYCFWSPQELGQLQPRSQPQMPADNSARASNGDSNARTEGTTAPVKRKDERSHEKVPPPQSRFNGAVSSRQDPSAGSQPDQNPQKNDASSSHESRAYQVDTSKQPSVSTPASAERPSVGPTQNLQRHAFQPQSPANSVDAPQSVQDGAGGGKSE
ncbi:hypothetical protein N7475_005380 [Penicillium sp. IBT 31633x]|nr:hypothetical protein N7475_005380 [Penicillium sp. IBT 31633x]